VVEIALFMSERLPDVTVRAEKELFSLKTGEHIGTQRRVFAQFRKGGIPEWAMDIALKRFAMAGKPSDIDPASWLATYDSVTDQIQRGWTDEEHELIVQKLREKGNVVEITPAKTAAPWPLYPKIVVHGRRKIENVVEQILAGIETTGVEPEAVLAFERQNLNRGEVLEAVTALAAGDEEEAEPLIAA
jgi:hypothetical protein